MSQAGQSVQMFCLKSYYTLFTNLQNETGDNDKIHKSEISYFFLDMLYLLGNPKESMTICDQDSEPKCETAGIYTTKES